VKKVTSQGLPDLFIRALERPLWSYPNSTPVLFGPSGAMWIGRNSCFIPFLSFLLFISLFSSTSSSPRPSFLQ
jgi:hypothetical protein